MNIEHQRTCRMIVVAGFVVAATLTVTTPAFAQDAPPAPGAFLGAVLVTDDAPTASHFYAELFGWDMEAAEDGGFAVRHKGRMIAGISPLRTSNPDFEESFWLVGLMIDNIDHSLEVAREQGAMIHEQVKRVSDYGRFAVITDRQGAPVMLIEPGLKPIGRTTGNGSWVWAELWTNDINDAEAFYADVIGVGHDTTDRGGQVYHLFTSEGKPRAGIIKIPKELEKVEPGWAPYVAVDDLSATLAKVKELGGSVVFGETEHPVDAEVALIRDPSGAVLFVYQIGSIGEVK